MLQIPNYKYHVHCALALSSQKEQALWNANNSVEGVAIPLPSDEDGCKIERGRSKVHRITRYVFIFYLQLKDKCYLWTQTPLKIGLRTKI